MRQAAPDEASLKAARALARPGPWSETGATETLVWGKCQGSGKTPYQVSIDLVAPAYRCSCPSRKFPCKHALALLLLWTSGDDISQVSEPSAYAAQWAADRADRAASGAARSAARAARAADPDSASESVEARAARRAARVATMDAGLADFGLWLRDVVRGGTAAARSKEPSWLEATAARLVDAQCPVLAAEVRELSRTLVVGTEWNGQVMAALGRMWTVVQAWQRREDLTEDEQADLRAALGWSWPTEEILARGSVSDDWLVLGAHRVDQGRLAEQRTWLRGQASGATRLLLDFAAGGQPLPMPRVTGAVLTGALASYPGAAPQRAVFAEPPSPGAATPYPEGVDVVAAVGSVAEHRAVNPLARRVPLVLSGVTVTTTQVIDATGRSLPLEGPPPYAALAACGGRPATVFGEWSDEGFAPLTVVVDGEAVPCG